MKIQKRIVNSQRHTLGYVVNNQEYTRHETVQLAREGRVTGVRVARASNTFYVVGTNTSLYNLPIKISTTHQLRNRRPS